MAEAATEKKEESKEQKVPFKFLMGKKIGMTQIFTDSGEAVPVSVVFVEPNRVLRLRTEEKDGYQSVQLGYDSCASRRLSRPLAGQMAVLSGAGKLRDVWPRGGQPPESLKGWRHIREFRVKSVEGFSPEQEIDVSIFTAGDLVDVSGVSKGKGFAGVVKRHGFGGGPKSHGQSDRLRAPGSLASRRPHGPVQKGKKMAGHMGHRRVTVRKVEVVGIDKEKKLILLCGGVPGPIGTVLEVRETKK